MAFNINPALVLALKSPQNWRGVLRHRLRRQINSVRSRRQRGTGTSNLESISGSSRFDLDRGITEAFEKQAEHFAKNGWAYITDFFTDEIHHAVLTAWPPISSFTVGSDPTKSYDKGPNWSGGLAGSMSAGVQADFYLGFQALLTMNFQTRVSQFCGDEVTRVNSGLGSAWARSGSLLLPHIDDVWQFGRGAVINFVIFIDGSEPALSSGATAVYSSNTFEQPIFIPPKLINTALVYETGRFIYHGFPRVGRGKFSKRLIAQYSPQNQPKLSEILSSERRNSEL